MKRKAPAPRPAAPAAQARDKTTQEILDIFDVDGTTLRRWINLGLPHSKSTGKNRGSKANLFSETEVAAFRKERGFTGEVGRPTGVTGSNAERLAIAKVRTQEALATLNEIKVAQAKGVLVEKSVVEQSNVQKFTVVRNKLLGMPSAVAPSITGLDAAAIEHELEERIRDILTELSRS